MSNTTLICKECGCTNDLSDYMNYMEKKFNEILNKAINEFHKEILGRYSKIKLKEVSK